MNKMPGLSTWADIRKFLIVGAMSGIRWIVRKGVLPDNWIGRLMARMIWPMMTRKRTTTCRDWCYRPAAAAVPEQLRLRPRQEDRLTMCGRHSNLQETANQSRGSIIKSSLNRYGPRLSNCRPARGVEKPHQEA